MSVQMPRRALHDSKGLIFHVVNRSVRRVRIFCDPADYRAFENLLTDTLLRIPTRLLAYTIMPNHWHMVIWPRGEELPRFMHRLTLTHAKRWNKAHGCERTGPLYQNRYAAIPVETGIHLRRVLRYVERNALRARLVKSAEDWRWSSLWHRVNGSQAVPLSEWPTVPEPDWIRFVNEPHEAGELEALRSALEHGWPIGETQWRQETAARLRISLRREGRPRRNRV
jgi:putative transposase